MSTGQENVPKQPRGESLDVGYRLFHCHLSALAVFIRRDFGLEALGINAFIAGLMILLTYAATGDPAMKAFLVMWLVAQIVQRVRSFRNKRRGMRIHSRYAGYPWLAMRVPFVRSETVAVRFVEPLLCLTAGWVLMHLSRPLGGFVMLGCVSFFIRNNIDAEIQRVRLRQMDDARIEAEWYTAEHAKNGH